MSLCSNAVIHVEIQNEGEDAFKPEKYGDLIIVERKISESTSSITLKDHQGMFSCVLIFFWDEVVYSYMFMFTTE